jgi:hypothetical protein
MTEPGLGPRIIVALDYPDAESARRVVARLSPELCRLKVGKELFVAAGPDFVRELVALGYAVFLDLKFHDIPHTVAQACRAAARLGVWMVNVHASGGPRMLAAAREALEGLERRPLLIAVTVLTSMGPEELGAIGVDAGPEQQVLRLARSHRRSGPGWRGLFRPGSPRPAPGIGAGFPPGHAGHSPRRRRNWRPDPRPYADSSFAGRCRLSGHRPAHHPVGRTRRHAETNFR